MDKRFLIFIIALLSIPIVLAEIDLMSFEANLFDSAGDPLNGNISIEVWDALTSGNLIYNSSNGFDDNITNGKVDIILGSDSSGYELNLTYGTTYYMEIYANGNDIDFNGLERQEFQASTGNISASRLYINDTITTQTLEPRENQSYDLGSLSNYFKNVYATTLTLLENATFLDSIFTDFIYPRTTDGNISLLGGNVGIGTANPISLLHLLPSSGNAKLTIETTAGNLATLSFARNTERANITYDNLAGDLTVLNHDGDIVLETNDNVGIGTSTPTQKLTVIGDVNITQGLNLSKYPSCVLETDGSGNLRCGVDAVGGGGEGVWAAGVNTIFNNTEGILVGIGTDTPSYGLHVFSTNVSLNDTLFVINDNVGIGISSPTHPLSVAGNSNFSGNALFESLARFDANASFGDNLTVGGSTFYADPSSNKVGIGTTSPTAELIQHVF
ncbi:hypothetical protein HYT56_00590 [Candidatus Woesearchaeota archaeon]|nr:hypothetical protein [Candidatus Woesearchaeota archaeon]